MLALPDRQRRLTRARPPVIGGFLLVGSPRPARGRFGVGGDGGPPVKLCGSTIGVSDTRGTVPRMPRAALACPRCRGHSALRSCQRRRARRISLLTSAPGAGVGIAGPCAADEVHTRGVEMSSSEAELGSVARGGGVVPSSEAEFWVRMRRTLAGHCRAWMAGSGPHDFAGVGPCVCGR